MEHEDMFIEMEQRRNMPLRIHEYDEDITEICSRIFTLEENISVIKGVIRQIAQNAGLPDPFGDKEE